MGGFSGHADQTGLVLETADPWEFITLFRQFRADPGLDRALRRAGRTTAEQFSWPNIVKRLLLPRLHPLAEPSSTEKLRPA